MYRAFLLVSLLLFGFNQPDPSVHSNQENKATSSNQDDGPGTTVLPENGALLLTRYNSLEDLEKVVQITYSGGRADTSSGKPMATQVMLTYNSRNRKITSILRPGVYESDFLKAKRGNLWNKIQLAFISPYAASHRRNLERVEILSRRKDLLFGEGDIAFYDLAATMVRHISAEDTAGMPAKDFTEKGFLNTFNHVMAQSFMTTLFSRSLADFVGDVHERSHLPELISGRFTPKQLEDIDDGPVDNYLDIINNECGQDLGQMLKEKYGISRTTYWTPELLRNYLNEIQAYHSWAFQIGFMPFRETDEMVIRFAAKINTVMGDVSKLEY